MNIIVRKRGRARNREGGKSNNHKKLDQGQRTLRKLKSPFSKRWSIDLPSGKFY